MRRTPNFRVESHRITAGQGYAPEFCSDQTYGNNGFFHIPHPTIPDQVIRCLVSDGMGWEHVSVSLPGLDRCPTWDEMCFVKDLFWDDEEVVLQYHPKRSEYVNAHAYVLHLWRPRGMVFPRPPKAMVG